MKGLALRGERRGCLSFTLGLFLIGAAATRLFSGQKVISQAASGTISVALAVLRVVLVVAAVILLVVRHSDVERIKHETEFPG